MPPPREQQEARDGERPDQPATDDALAFQNLHELEPLAARVLTPSALAYYAGYAGDGDTARENARCWSRLRLVPRVLRDVSACDPSVELCGRWRLACPVIVAPMAMHGLADSEEAERATVRAAAAEGVGMAVSTMANVPLAELAALSPRPPLLLFQLYVLRDRDLVEAMVRRAEASGYDALCVTVDAPRLGRREGDERSKFALPEGLELGNLRELAERKRRTAGEGKADAVLRLQAGGAGDGGGGAASSAAAAAAAATATTNQSGLFALFASEVDDALDWSFLTWLRSVTSLPIWLKGVLHPADAALAHAHGCSGVVVSNHGGRQLDGAPTSADALPAVARALAGTGCLIIADGGVRRGADVVKALALGAHAVMVGRPLLYALAVGGEAAQRRALALLRAEVGLAMALCGLASPEQARCQGKGLVLRGEYGEVPSHDEAGV
jgi:isopentenyl diphosphate isomerase/L-lactate dehydrogenase-like FMN-dependent dehydrogenase